jgi:flagellar hook-associated protein 3 FlgL
MTSEQQVSSGLRVSQASDDPSAAADIIQLSTQSTETNEYTQNLTLAQSSLNTADSTMTNIQNIIDRLNTLALSTQNGSATDASSTVSEISSLESQLVSLANTTNDQGQYIFGGTVTNQPPYTQNSDGSVTYSGNSSPVTYQVGTNTTLQTQIPGSQIFNGSVDIFSTISSLVSALQSGDQNGITQATQDLQTFSGNVSTANTQVGSLLDTAQSLQTQYTNSSTTLTQDLQNVQDADTATAITQLEQGQTSLEATLQVGAQISQISLLKYLTTS